MTLETGTYQIFSPLKTANAQLRIARYAPEEPWVNDSSNQTVYVEHIDGDRYYLKFFQDHDTFFGPSSDISIDNTLKSRPGAFEWAVDPADSGNYKIHIPNQEYYWQIPDDAGNETKITLDKIQGKTGELWSFKPSKASG
ncbi:peptidase inhibitor i66 [Ceratobasidium sp. AG-Ba]|nr:peptidase inhibitor i66 [Ceratobasidium sp. AG-Ba]